VAMAWCILSSNPIEHNPSLQISFFMLWGMQIFYWFYWPKTRKSYDYKSWLSVLVQRWNCGMIERQWTWHETMKLAVGILTAPLCTLLIIYWRETALAK
jgi:hypothetical protein